MSLLYPTPRLATTQTETVDRRLRYAYSLKSRSRNRCSIRDPEKCLMAKLGSLNRTVACALPRTHQTANQVIHRDRRISLADDSDGFGRIAQRNLKAPLQCFIPQTFQKRRRHRYEPWPCISDPKALLQFIQRNRLACPLVFGERFARGRRSSPAFFSRLRFCEDLQSAKQTRATLSSREGLHFCDGVGSFYHLLPDSHEVCVTVSPCRRIGWRWRSCPDVDPAFRGFNAALLRGCHAL